MKKTLLSALIISGATLFAGTSLNIKMDKGNEFLKESNSLSFRKPVSERNVLKLKNTRFSASGREWEESEVTGGGLFINFGLFFPPDNYLNPYYESGDLTYGLGFNLEFGNYFRFAKIADGKFGIGLRATWMSFGYTKVVDDKDIYRALEMSFLRVGPQFGIALNEKMGLDIFYQLGFNLTQQFASIDSPGQSKTIGASSSFTGISHEIGAAFHFQVYSIGFGYRFGKLTNFLNYYDGKEYDADTDKKYGVGSLRITLGFKF